MNMKTLSIILMLASSLNAFADESSEEAVVDPSVMNPAAVQPGTEQTPEKLKASLSAYAMNEQYSPAAKCPVIFNLTQQLQAKGVTVNQLDQQQKFAFNECVLLKRLSNNGPIANGSKDNTKKSSDGRISCVDKGSYTLDYEPCEKAIKYYSAVMMAEQAMLLEQKVRTDLAIQKNEKKTQESLAKGQSQTAAFDAAEANHNHMQGIHKEKLIAYGAAGVALYNAQRMLPTFDGEKKKYCGSPSGGMTQQECEAIFKKHKGSIIANSDAKNALIAAAMDVAAKAAAAGLQMQKFDKAGDDVAAARASITDDTTNVMMEKCVINPTDPACARNRNRTAGQSLAAGEFGSGSGENNSFNLGGETEVTPEMGAETNIDENAPIAGVNTPFAEDAKIAKGILDPAAGAQTQASGGAQGGGGGGAGGGGGGGGASLGSDLNGANKDGDKEAQIKTNKVAGAYSQGGGGGYKGVGRSKDDANPFSSLFDAKGSGGGVEEDRSIASGDIDGAASGLFQKISKRYGQVQADKRIQANNLE